MAGIILLDTSGSMALPIRGKRRIHVLADILVSVLRTAPGTRLFGFGDVVAELDNAVTEHGINLPEPSGGTALAEALSTLVPLKPNPLIVISDGEPNDPREAIAVAATLGATISTYYCGDEGNRRAIAFLRDLALCSKGGIGRARIGDLSKPGQIAVEMQRMLAGPAR